MLALAVAPFSLFSRLALVGAGRMRRRGRDSRVGKKDGETFTYSAKALFCDLFAVADRRYDHAILSHIGAFALRGGGADG